MCAPYVLLAHISWANLTRAKLSLHLIHASHYLPPHKKEPQNLIPWLMELVQTTEVCTNGMDHHNLVTYCIAGKFGGT